MVIELDICIIELIRHRNKDILGTSGNHNCLPKSDRS